MKKSLFMILSAAAMLTAGCEADRSASEGVLVEKELTFKAASVECPDAGVRTSLVDGGGVWWSPGDAISLFYGSGDNGGSRFTAQTDEPAAVTNFSGRIGVITGGGEIGETATMFWATYPYNVNASCDGNSIVTELPDSQVGKAGTFSDSTFVTVARSQGLVLSFYNVCSGLKFSVTNPEVEQVRIRSNGGEPIAGKARIAFDTNGVPYVSEVLDGTDEITISAPEGGCFEVGQNYYITMLPQTLASGFTVTLETAGQFATRTVTSTATFKRAVFNSMLSADKSVTYAQKPADVEYVDLGLSVMWATCNLGASSPEEYGGYYQWGGLEDVTSTSIYLDYSNCPYHTGSDTNTGWTKYISYDKSSFWSGSGSPDNKTALDSDDDVAHVKLGDKWRMPTSLEWQELYSYCTGEWVTLSGVQGMKFTSEKNGNSIFLPAAGNRENDNLNKAGSTGRYLSSVSEVSPCVAVHFGFESNSGKATMYIGNRPEGYSVRPVYGDRVSVTDVSLSAGQVFILVGETTTLHSYVNPSRATERNVSWSSSNNSVATVDARGKVTAVAAGTATITVTTTDGGKTASCPVRVFSEGPEYVDLGLSVKWANCNLGASVPEEYGDYYAWGDIETYYEDGYAQESPQQHWKSGKSGGYSGNNYKFYQREIAETDIYDNDGFLITKAGSVVAKGYTKYVPESKADQDGFKGFYDGKTVLDIEDDVARIKLGGKWRMPTSGEIYELIKNCTWTWASYKGVNGYKVTSNIAGYTDKWIFLPAASSCYHTNLVSVGSGGCYWSSSLSTLDPNLAYSLSFYLNDVGGIYNGRSNGFSVRPVSE